MSDDQHPGGTHGAPDVGSLGEEAAKLFGALADVAKQHSGDSVGGLGSMAGHAAGFAKNVNEHLATDSAECQYCPICRTVHLVRSTTPEVKAHLYTAATSLLQAAMGLMETIPPPEGAQGSSPRGAEVERIDLDNPDGDA
ncbi:hypothetical protein [Nocardioides montaniterrae]